MWYELASGMNKLLPNQYVPNCDNYNDFRDNEFYHSYSDKKYVVTNKNISYIVVSLIKSTQLIVVTIANLLWQIIFSQIPHN